MPLRQAVSRPIEDYYLMRKNKTMMTPTPVLLNKKAARATRKPFSPFLTLAPAIED
jgi:hypothetical protein